VDGSHPETLEPKYLALKREQGQHSFVPSLPLSEILNAVRQLPNEYGVDQTPWNNPNVDRIGVDLSKVRRVGGPDSFDSGPIGRGIPVYSSEEREEVGKVKNGTSLDVLAWYVSYHSNPNLWGIYLSRLGVYSVANSLIGEGANPHEAIELAKTFLIRHEATHFQTDLGITSIELAQNKPIYLHARHNTKKGLPPWNLKEEGLANSFGRRRLKSQARMIESLLNSSPDGYREWNQYTTSVDAWTWKAIIEELVMPVATTGNVALAAETSNIIAPKYFGDIPVYEVDDVQESELGTANFLGPIQEIIETDEFHKDMKKLMKGQPSYKKKWENTKNKLASGNTIGVHLEVINKKKAIHSVQIDGEARAGIQKTASWFAIAAGHHDELYRRLNSK
jgi:hypothetical protein